MSDKTDAGVIDLADARRQRIHDIHDARLEAVRDAFARALPLPKSRSKKKRGKKNKPR
jgi:hypothetical protein